MIGTNRDLVAMRAAIEHELLQLQLTRRLSGRSTDTDFTERQIASLNRKRVALSAAIVNRRIEAAKDIVVFSRWANGNGALSTIIPSFG
jgi:ABC-type siderophore export system fused ATPase/permease subunit